MEKTIVTLERDVLLDGLKLAVLASSTKQKWNEWADKVSFDVDAEKKIKIRCMSDMGSVSVDMDVVDMEGDSCGFCVEAKKLVDCLKLIPNQPVRLTVDKQLSLGYFGGEYQFPMYDSALIPRAEIESDCVELAVGSAVVAEGIETVMNFVSNDDFRPALAGVLMEVKGNTLNFVGTDGHVLGWKSSVVACEGEFRVILCKDGARMFFGMLSALKENEVRIRVGSRGVYAEIAGVTVEVRLGEGMYPNYRSVIPENKNEVVADMGLLKRMLDRLAVVADKAVPTMKLHVRSGVMEVALESVSGSGHEEMTVSADAGFEIKMGLNLVLLRGILSSVKTDSVKLLFSEPHRAMLATSPGMEERVTLLIMPVGLDG